MHDVGLTRWLKDHAVGTWGPRFRVLKEAVTKVTRCVLGNSHFNSTKRLFLSIFHRKWVGSQAIQTQVAACFLTGEFRQTNEVSWVRHSFRYYSPAKWNSLWSYGSCVRISLLFLKLHWKLYIWTRTVGHSVINTSLLCSRLISSHVHITHFWLAYRLSSSLMNKCIY